MRELIERFVREFGKRSLGTYAASITYCVVLAAFPALILVSAILPYTSLSEADVVYFFLTIFPDASSSLVMQVCAQAYQSSGSVLSITLVFLLWSAGFGVMQLTRGLNAINDRQEHRNYFLLRGISTLYTLLMLALMLATLFLQVFVGQIVDLWESAFPSTAPHLLTSTVRLVILFLAAVALFLLLFTTLPVGRKSLLSQLPGALIAAIGWEVFSAIFTLYVRYSERFSIYYGSLTTAVVLLLWLYWCLYIMLFGAFFNRFLELEGLGLKRRMREKQG